MAPRPELNADVQAQAASTLAARAVQVAKTLAKRNDGYKNLASAGSRPATDLTGPGFQVLFALIGVGMTVMCLWFFFWAKNGGFKWREDDWEDYKSTVLRRKGPDGKTLSNASKSTRLGGGSVVHGGSYGAPTSIGYTDETGTSADMSEIRDAEEGKHHGLRGGDGRRHKKKHRRDYENDYNDPDLDGYRHEKSARVGGLNRQADGMYTDYTPTEPSDLGSNVSGKPLVKKDKRDPKKEAKEKERRARERMKNAKAAEKEAQKAAAAEAKARKEADKAAAKREKANQKQAKKTRSEAGSEMPEMAETRTEYTRAYTEYTAPSEYDQSEVRDFAVPPLKPRSPVKSSTPAKAPSNARRAPPSAAYSFTTGDDDANTVYTGAYTEASDNRTAAESSYYSDYRPRAERSQARTSQSRDRRSQSQSRPRPAGSRSRPSSQSPQKRHRTSQQPAAPASDIFTTANGASQGHMSYPCYIPGLSVAGTVVPGESVSQVGAPGNHRRSRERGSRDVMAGYRRGGGRRDSLSDSDS